MILDVNSTMSNTDKVTNASQPQPKKVVVADNICTIIENANNATFNYVIINRVDRPGGALGNGVANRGEAALGNSVADLDQNELDIISMISDLLDE